MTAALIKHLLLDASLCKLSFELNADLISAVQNVLVSGAFNDQNIAWLDLYLSGYTAEDIAERYVTTVADVNVVLERIFVAIAQTSGYTDELFVQHTCQTRKVSPYQLDKMRKYLMQESQNFTVYEAY
jgi:hypothetical protein